MIHRKILKKKLGDTSSPEEILENILNNNNINTDFSSAQKVSIAQQLQRTIANKKNKTGYQLHEDKIKGMLSAESNYTAEADFIDGDGNLNAHEQNDSGYFNELGELLLNKFKSKSPKKNY